MLGRKQWAARAAALAISLTGLVAPAVARAECKLVGVAQYVVEIRHQRILIPSEINGQKVYFALDTGGRSLLTNAAAIRLGLPMRNTTTAQLQQRYFGIGGELQPRVATLKQVKIGGVDMSGVEMLVVGDRSSDADDIVGFIGYDVFARYDVEFDLAHNAVRLLKSAGCSDDEMDYWRAPYAVTPLVTEGSSENPHSHVFVELNGVRLDAILDTGSPRTTVTLAAAARAGERPGMPGVERVWRSGGLVGRSVDVWAAPFKTFSIGEEKINKPTLPMADLFQQVLVTKTGSSVPVGMAMPQMLVGLDFFRAHRVLISREHHKVYFSYNGGPDVHEPI